MTTADDANFWAEERAREEADRGRVADPSACDTCRRHVSEGRPVEHDECAQRATLLQAPDQISYEVLVDLTDDEKAALPPRFHTPTFLDTCKPKGWACAVCWGDGWTTSWPCAAALEHGTEVFTPRHEAERQQALAVQALEQARSIAVRLEQESAGLLAAVREVAESAAGKDTPTGGEITQPGHAAPRTERSYWQAIADALNAPAAAGMHVGIDLDGTLTDHQSWSVVWDRQAEQWAVAGYDDEDEAEAPAAPDFFRAGHTYSAPHRWKFRCDTITTHPGDGELTALGWRLFDSAWEPYAYHRDDWEILRAAGMNARRTGGDDR